MAKKILAIDDDRTNTTMVETGLIKAGYEVMIASDGALGLEMAISDSPDLILLDIEMPKMNGYTFITELRKNDQLKNTPVIILTSYAEMQPIFALKGVKEYLLKPVIIEQLTERIEKVLSENQS